MAKATITKTKADKRWDFKRGAVNLEFNLDPENEENLIDWEEILTLALVATRAELNKLRGIKAEAKKSRVFFCLKHFWGWVSRTCPYGHDCPPQFPFPKQSEWEYFDHPSLLEKEPGVQVEKLSNGGGGC